MGAEAFTILAILEAQDRASAIMARVDKAFDTLSSSALRAAESTSVAGAAIDESLLATASSASASEVAAAQLTAARSRLTLATREQATAEHALIDASLSVGEGGQVNAEIMARQAAASNALAAAERRVAAASNEITAAQTRQAAIGATVIAQMDALLLASDRVAVANSRVAMSSETAAANVASMGKGFKVASLVLAAAAVVSVKAAGDFENAVVHLVTDAGESASKLGMVKDGLLDIARETGTSSLALANAMYRIESAGYHAGEGLTLMKVAAEGAKVGNADLDVVSKALTGTMNAYGMGADEATSMMNQLITTTANGDLRMQDLALSLGNVAPIAAAAGLEFSQVGGAIATMTAQNMTAQRASQNLANTIRALQAPNREAIWEMEQMGLSSNDVTQNLGKRGLTGTMELLTKAVANHTKGGQVLINTFNASKTAAKNASIAIKAMPEDLQKLATSYMNGTVSYKVWHKEIGGLPAIQRHMMQQFAQLADRTNSFNTLLASGSPAAQTYNAAMKKMMGGATGLNTALMITGGRMSELQDATAAIAKSAKHGGTEVENWSTIQGTFNQKIDVLKSTVGAAGIEIGTVLLPAASKFVDIMTGAIKPLADFIAHNQKIIGLIASMAGGAMAAAMAIKVIAIATRAWAIAMGLVNTMMAIFATEAELTGIPELIIAIAALVAGLIYCYYHFKTFRDVVMVVFNAVKLYVTTGIKVMLFEFHMLVAGAMLMWHGMVAAWNGIVIAAKWLWQFLTSTWNAIAATTSAVWGVISDFFAKWWPLLLVIFAPGIAILISIWNHFHDEIWNAVKATWGAVKGFLVANWDAIKVMAKVAWGLIKTFVVEPVLLIWANLKKIWAMVEPYLSSAWNSIKGQASAVWNAIKNAIIKPVMDAWNRVKAGQAAINAEILNKLKAAWAAVKAFAGRFVEVGKAIVMGVVRGAKDAGSALVSSMKDLANSALDSAKSFLGISSPSKKFKALGGWIVHGLVDGLTASTARVKTATTRLAKDLYVDFGSQHKGLQAYVAKEDKELLKLANRRDDYAKRLKAAQSHLADLRKAWTAERNQIAQGVMQSVSVVMAAPETGQLTPAQILENLQKQAQEAKTFANDLATLKKKGLRSDLIAQLAAAGADAGGATAAALTSANSRTIKQLNSTQKSLVTTANSTGKVVADSMYGAGIKSAEGLIKGLKSKKKDIEDLMLDIARSMQKALKKALGIKSPSTVFAEVGKWVPHGMAKGINDNALVAEKAVSKLGDTLITAGAATKKKAMTTAGSGLTIPFGNTAHGVGGKNTGGDIIFDLRGSQVMSDSDMDKLVNKIGKRLATSVLPSGGTRIRM